MTGAHDDIMVSIIMPIYNGREHLKESLDSMVSQTHRNWELIIINEYGSDDGSLEIINDYAKSDDRFVIIQNKERLGISASMNVGIEAAKGKYVARMDSDDISLPKRLERQIKFMEAHEEIVMCGVRARTFGSKSFRWRLEYDPDVIWTNLLFYSPCIHPTIMVRAEFLRKNGLRYNEKLKATEDYDLFSRIGELGKIGNVNEILFRYRMEGGNTTFRNNDTGLNTYLEIIDRQCSHLGLSFSADELDTLSPHGKLNTISGSDALEAMRQLDDLLMRIFTANEEVGRYDRNCLMKTLHRRFHEGYRDVKQRCDVKEMYDIYHGSLFSTDSAEDMNKRLSGEKPAKKANMFRILWWVYREKFRTLMFILSDQFHR